MTGKPQPEWSSFCPGAETEIRRVDPLQGDEWDKLVIGCPDASPFHRSAWARVLAETYHHKPFYHAILVSGQPAVLLPLLEVASPLTGRRGVSLPFTDFCGPLVFKGFSHFPLAPWLADFARQRRWEHFELRAPLPGLIPDATPAVSYYAHVLDLQKGLISLESSLHSSHRRSLKKVAGSGLRIERRTDAEAIEIFYKLHCGTRKRHGLPPQPREFFNQVFNEIIGKESGFVVLGFREQSPLAGAVFFHSEKRAVYKFGASDAAGNEARANHAVMWHGIRYLSGNGFESLHFGRTSLHQEGLRRYKSYWGAGESVIDYFRFDPWRGEWKKGRDKAGGRHNAVFSRLPLTLNRLLGAVIYPHLD